MVKIKSQAPIIPKHGSSPRSRQNNRWTWNVLLVIMATVISVAVQCWIGYHFYHYNTGGAKCDDGTIPNKASFVRQAMQQSSPNAPSICQDEYQRITAKRTPGLTTEDLKRSFVYSGNRHRLSKLAAKLKARREQVTAVVTGGSISLGHGVEKGLRYSDRLATWMNDMYPLTNQQQPHQVWNKGSHGADVSFCKLVYFLFSGDWYILCN